MIVILNYAQYQYLKENNILENYKNALNFPDLDCTIDLSKDRNFLTRSFTWSMTVEGHDFWKKYEKGSMDLHHSDIYTFETK